MKSTPVGEIIACCHVVHHTESMILCWSMQSFWSRCCSRMIDRRYKFIWHPIKPSNQPHFVDAFQDKILIQTQLHVKLKCVVLTSSCIETLCTAGVICLSSSRYDGMLTIPASNYAIMCVAVISRFLTSRRCRLLRFFKKLLVPFFLFELLQ